MDDKEKAWSFFKSNFNIILHMSKPQLVSSKRRTAFEYQLLYEQP